jgi:ABC-type Zn uptake system ZnuABC Zn-binding protein ZnuA
MTPFFWPRLRLGITVLVFLVGAVALVSCGGDEEAAGDDGKVKVITTLPLFADFVRNVGGDRVEVTSLLPLGADPHTFEPSPRDVEKITEADIAFANGLDLEPSLVGIIEPNLPEGAPLVILAEAVIEAGGTTREGGEEEEGEEHEGEPEVPEEFAGMDPHLWMDPANAVLYITTMRDSLSDVDPNGSDIFTANAESYGGEIDEVEEYVGTETKSIPPDLRKLVTTHDAFGYFADAFGFEVTEFVAESPGGDPSPQDIAAITAALEDQSVPAVFVEPQVHEEGQVLEQAAADAGVEVCVLYSDSLDDTVTSYIELMRFNADELARCLG